MSEGRQLKDVTNQLQGSLYAVLRSFRCVLFSCNRVYMLLHLLGFPRLFVHYHPRYRWFLSIAVRFLRVLSLVAHFSIVLFARLTTLSSSTYFCLHCESLRRGQPKR